METSRRDFIKKTCPTIAFAFFGLSFLEACSSEEMPNVVTTTPTTNNGDILLDLNDSSYAELKSIGGFINLTASGLLILKISETVYGAYDNCCPHQGSTNSWTYDTQNQKFKCGSHSNQFGIENNTIVSCNSGNESGNLKSYTTSLSGSILTIKKS